MGHPISLDSPELYHDRRREHVQACFLNQAAFHSSGARDDFRTDFRCDGNLRGLRQRRLRITSQRQATRTDFTGDIQSPQSERSSATRRNCQHKVAGTELSFFQCLCRGLGVIFGKLDSFPKCAISPRDDSLYALAGPAKGRRHFGSIQNPHSTAGAGAHVEPATARSKSRRESSNGLGQLGQNCLNRSVSTSVLLEDQREHIADRHPVKRPCRFQNTFGRTQLGHDSPCRPIHAQS